MAALDSKSVNAASGQLNAFANAVQAQAGKKLAGELASFLTESAIRIRAALGR